jgi:hypothetical protein
VDYAVIKGCTATLSRDFAFSPISAASQPFLLRALSYMRDLPRERAVSQQIGVDDGGSKNRDLTLDPLKRGRISTGAWHGKSIYRRAIYRGDAALGASRYCDACGDGRIDGADRRRRG